MLYLAIILMLQQAAAPAPAASAKAPAPQAVAVQAAPAAAPMLAASELLQVKNVYILPMSSSLDQYVANRLTRDGVLQVVTDPGKADAILTDRLGKGFEAKFEELYPDPAKKAAAEAAAAARKDEEGADDHPMEMKTNVAERSGGGGRAKGTLFLVHRGSRNVIWSVYELPKSTRPEELDSVAGAAVKNLAGAMGKQAKAAGVTDRPAGKKSGWRPW